MRLLYTTDLHGNKQKYNKLIEVIRSTKPTVVINGGDMLPKKGDLFKQKKFITSTLQNHFKQCNELDVYYLCFLCNDDLKIFDELFDNICSRFSFVKSIAQRKFEIGGYEFIGFNFVVDYPFRLKDRCRKDTQDYSFQKQLGTGLLSAHNGWIEIPNWFDYANSLPTIEEELERLVKPHNYKKTIYVIHMPPANLRLDKCGNTVASHGAEVGSKAIYNFLYKNQPLISLHGHIHESPEITGKYYAKLGKTLCVQPGQPDEYFVFVIIDLPKIDIKIMKEKI